MNVTWRRHGLIIAIAIATGLYIALSDASTFAKVGMVVVFFVAVTLWRNARDLRVHSLVSRYSALGQPEPILDLVDSELAQSSSPRIQVPFSIYKAMALGLQGHWDQGLAVLRDIDLGSARGKTRRTWQFLYYSHLLNCLLFLDQLDEAREVFDNKIEPFAKILATPGAVVIADEARAKLAFFEQRYDDSREGFQALAADQRIATSSRAIYHYFLGRIALATDRDPTEHFDEAVKLAPDTFIPASVDQLRASL